MSVQGKQPHVQHVVIKGHLRECDRKREDEILAEVFSDLIEVRGIEAAMADMILTARQGADVMVDITACGWHVIFPSTFDRHDSQLGVSSLGITRSAML